MSSAKGGESSSPSSEVNNNGDKLLRTKSYDRKGKKKAGATLKRSRSERANKASKKRSHKPSSKSKKEAAKEHKKDSNRSTKTRVKKSERSEAAEKKKNKGASASETVNEAAKAGE